ncbi:MAG: WHG domain-containing protein [Pseudomonadota bacterium]
MTGKREQTRRELTERLLQAAEELIEVDGLEGTTARTVTQRAQCGLGTLYKCYADLDDLIIHVNSRTLKKLGAELAASTEGFSDPVEQLQALALSYIHFAEQNHTLWTALFEHNATSSEPIPKWHEQENTALLTYIAKPVMGLEPELKDEALAARSRTYFAAIHGLVVISLQGRFVGLSPDVLRSETKLLVSRMAQPK